MKIKCLLLSVVLILCTVLAGCNINDDKDLRIFEQSGDGVTLRVELDKATYHPDDIVKARITLINNSNTFMHCEEKQNTPNISYSNLVDQRGAPFDMGELINWETHKKLVQIEPSPDDVTDGFTIILPGEEIVYEYQFKQSTKTPLGEPEDPQKLKNATYSGVPALQWIWIKEGVTIEELTKDGYLAHKDIYWDKERPIVEETGGETVFKKRFTSYDFDGQEVESYTPEYTNVIAVPFTVTFAE